MRLVAMIAPTETREIQADGEDYDDARAAVLEQIPDGWRLLSVRTVRD